MSDDSGGLDGNCSTITIDAVHYRADHIRKSFCSLDPLKMTVSDAGLLQPILVIRESDGTYAVVDGARRLAALRELGVRDLIVGRDIVVDVEETEADVRFKQIIVNVQREDLNAIELGQAFVTLKEEYGYRYNEIAEIIGKTPHYVAAKVGLVKRLDPQVQCDYLSRLQELRKEKCIQSNFSGGSHGYLMNVNVLEDIARIPRELQAAAYKEIASREMDKGVAISYLRELKDMSPAGQEPAEGHAAAPGEADHAVRAQILMIKRGIERLAGLIGEDTRVGPAQLAEIESLIKQLSLLCVQAKVQKTAGLKGHCTEKPGFADAAHGR